MQVSFVVFRPVEDSTQDSFIADDAEDDFEEFMADGRDYYGDEMATTPALGGLAPNVHNIHLEVFQTGNVAVAKLSVHENEAVLRFMGDSSLSKLVDNDGQYWIALAEAFQNAADHFYMMSS